jgi:phosphate-selective porin OprO/OprP
MAEFDAKRIENGQTEKRLSPEVEQEILRAMSRIDYGSIEVVVHDGKVVQIECREKIRVVRDEPGRKNAIRPIRGSGYSWLAFQKPSQPDGWRQQTKNLWRIPDRMTGGLRNCFEAVLRMKWFRLRISAGVLAASVIVASPFAVAQDDVNQLRQQVEELDQKIRILQRKQEVETETAAAKDTESARVTAGPEGFGINSADNAFRLNFHGDLQVDSRSYQGTRLSSPPGTQTPDTLLIRRARPIIEATLYDKYDFRPMPDFGGGQTVLFDAYGQARFASEFQLRAGKFKSPVGLEQLQIDDNLFFAERSLATDLVPNRDVGAQLQGDLIGGTLNYAIGVFNGVIDAANGDVDSNSGKDAEARLFAKPFKNGIEVLRGLGLGVAYTKGRQTGTATTANLPTYKTIGQQALFAYGSGAFANGTRQRISPQAFYYYGPFGLLTEYVRSSQDVTRAGVTQDMRNRAWNVTAGWVLTGEDPTFEGVTPRRPFVPGGDGWGAFQVVARVSKLTVDDDAFRGGAATRLADPTASAR